MSRNAQDCGEEPKICNASQPISCPRPTALLTPPDVETCAPISIQALAGKITGSHRFQIGVTQLEIFTLTLTLSLKGEGMIELRKSYQIGVTHLRISPPP